MKNYHYVYRITNLKENKHYYGCRSCDVHPKNDLSVYYFSSSSDEDFMNDQKCNPQHYKYKVIRITNTRKEALKWEIALHEKFEVAINENFYNLCKQTNTKFCTKGNKIVAKRISNSLKGHYISEETRVKISISNTGKKRTEETKEKMSITLSDPNVNNWILNNPSHKYIKCEHCNKTINQGTYFRDHGENCLYNPKLTTKEQNDLKKYRSERSYYEIQHNPTSYNILTKTYQRITKETFFYNNNYIAPIKGTAIIYKLTLPNDIIYFITNKYWKDFLNKFNPKVSKSFFDKQFRLETQNFNTKTQKTKIFIGSSFDKFPMTFGNELLDFYYSNIEHIYSPNVFSITSTKYAESIFSGS